MSENTKKAAPLQKATKIAVARLAKCAMDKSYLNASVKKRLVTSGLARYILMERWQGATDEGREPVVGVELTPDGRLVSDAIVMEVRQRGWSFPTLLPAIPNQPAQYKALKFANGKWYVAPVEWLGYWHSEQFRLDPNYQYKAVDCFMAKEEYDHQMSEHGSVEWSG